MSTPWRTFVEGAPAFAAYARGRIETYRLALLATLRADGAPRISGLEPFFAGDHLWLGLMPRSRKGADLHRDGRFALHNATVDKHLEEGDVKISGIARPLLPGPDAEVFATALGADAGYDPSHVDAFWADLTSVASIRIQNDQLVIHDWRPGEPVRIRRRT